MHTKVLWVLLDLLNNIGKCIETESVFRRICLIMHHYQFFFHPCSSLHHTNSFSRIIIIVGALNSDTNTLNAIRLWGLFSEKKSMGSVEVMGAGVMPSDIRLSIRDANYNE